MKVQLHSAGDASALTALFLGQLRAVSSLVMPWQASVIVSENEPVTDGLMCPADYLFRRFLCLF